MKKIGYIDDNKYVEAYLRQCESIPKYSKFEIKMKLINKGIDKDLIDEKLSSNLSSDYEQKIVEKLKNGKLKNMDIIKQKSYLYRRGFKISEDIDLS